MLFIKTPSIMKNTKLTIALLTLFAVQGLQAQEDDFRKSAPKPGPAPEIQFGEYEEFTLDNGLQVIVVENHKLPRVAFNLLVDVPPAKEEEFAGAAELAGAMLSRGTENRGKAEIDADVDSILDEIDDVLEENAEEFVASFVQKGGQ